MEPSEQSEKDVIKLQDLEKSLARESRFRVLLSKMVHLIALGLPVVIIWLAQPGASLFPWHPTLMSIGFGFLMTEAIMLFSPQSSVLPTLSRATKAQVHWMIQLGAITFTSTGFAVIIYNKYLYGKNHFTSWHGWFGLATMIMVFLQALQGVSIFYPSFALFKAKLGQRKQLHALFGTLVFMLASTTIVLGYFSSWFVNKTNDIVWWGSVFSTLVMAGIIVGQVTNEYAARNKPSK
ncbi:hypothetical protein QZH41_019901 [Actinostola sp. cb2023]|nr:hypothetical protein QZH41_019901 [Actinostola sp. cb2023]